MQLKDTDYVETKVISNSSDGFKITESNSPSKKQFVVLKVDLPKS